MLLMQNYLKVYGETIIKEYLETLFLWYFLKYRYAVNITLFILQ